MKIRVLIAKPGLDGHDVGAKVVCRGLMDHGMEVVYTGLRQSPDAIARIALEEAVHVVGLSILSGAHVPLCERTAAAMKAAGVFDDVLWLVGGNIPRKDIPALQALGVRGVFPTSSALDDIAAFIRDEVHA